MTYKVFGRTLSLPQSINHTSLSPVGLNNFQRVLLYVTLQVDSLRGYHSRQVQCL